MAPPTETAAPGWYLFAVLPADGDLDLAGCPPFDATCRVELVRAGGMFVAVARVPIAESLRDGTALVDPERLTALVNDHDRVVREAAQTGRSVVPLPFGTVAADIGELRSLVEAHAPALLDALSRLEGCDEWGVHVTVPREATQRAVRTLAKAVHDRLAACAEDAVIEPIAAGAREARPSALSAAFLVNRDRGEHFSRTVDDLRARWEIADGSIQVSGPWPCYHFARVDLGAAPQQGAQVLLGPLSNPEHAWSTPSRGLSQLR
jgi:hypothetical protein